MIVNDESFKKEENKIFLYFIFQEKEEKLFELKNLDNIPIFHKNENMNDYIKRLREFIYE